MSDTTEVVTAKTNTDTAVFIPMAASVTEIDARGREIQTETIDGLMEAIKFGETFGDLNKLEVSTVNLKETYRSFEEKGETIRRTFAGFTLRESIDPSTGENKGYLPAARLYNPETETVEICMQTVLVGVIYERKYPKGYPIQITYIGDAKAKSGLRYNDFDVRGLK